MIVSLSGRPGSGKSAVGKRLAERLGFAHLSAGDFMRSMAEERDMSILELSKVAEQGDEIDREIDARTRRLGDTMDRFVIDARLGWWVLPESFKVFLDVTPEEAARRVYGAGRGAELENVDLVATEEAIRRRTVSESDRYLHYYGVDYLDPSHYDLLVDTTRLGIEQVVDLIVQAIEARTG